MRTAPNRLDLVGQQFGRLTVTSLAKGRGTHGEVNYNCRCECGSEIVRNTNKLRTGRTKSCGCLRHRSGREGVAADNRPLLERLMEKTIVDPVTGCKLIGGVQGGHRYGHIMVDGNALLAHRAAWEEANGPIPDGLHCLHNCPGGDNPCCWNVDHLWLGTQADNNADRDRKGRHVALKGEMHGMSELTDDEVRAIREIPRRRGAATEAAKRFGISLSTVCKIIKRQAWKHIA